MERSYLPMIAGFVRRARIDALIQNSLKYALVLVLAGPGYGKTLSVSNYMKTADVRLIWVRISKRRNTAGEFWDDFVLAAKREMPAYAQKLQELGFPASAGSFEQFRQITAETAEEGNHLVWVIDKYELILDKRVIRFLNYLFDGDLPNFTLFILCNVILPFAEVLPATGLYRITDKQLAFTVEETKLMFELYGTSATPELIEATHKTTGGWPLGLRLVCESKNENLDHFSNRTPVQLAADLLEHYYFSEYSEDVQTQLVLLSLLPRFSMDMVRGKAGMPDEEFYKMLMQHPFISYDYLTSLFLFQPMYHDFLRQKRTLLSLESRGEMLARAGRWFLDHGMMNEAMDGFWEAADYDGFLESIGKLPLVRKQTGLTNSILKRLEQIPRSYADKRPEVDYSIAFMYLNAAEAERARKLLFAVEERLKEQPETEERRLLLGDIYATLADISVYLNEDTGLQWIKKACELIPQGSRTHSPELMALGNNSVFYLPHNGPGELDRMVGFFMEYAKYADQVKNGCGHGYEYLFAGEAAYFKEEMDRAAAMFNSAMLKAERTGQHDIICNALWGLGHIELYYANHKNVLALLGEIEEYIDSNHLMGLCELRDCAKAHFYMQMGDLDKVPPWFGQTKFGMDEMPLSLGRNRLLTAHYLYRRGEVTRAYALLLELESQLAHKGRWQEKFSLYVVKAQCHLAMKEEAEFEKMFKRAYDMVYQNDIKILLFAYGKDMMVLIDQLKKQDAGAYDMPWLDEVYRDAVSYAKRMQMMRRAYSGERYGAAKPGLRLTARENETLRYLAQGLTQQEMAKLMGISSNAVKKHVSKIYYKLGAVNRADAIHIASINGLVDVLSG
ncbi:LuxR C-terminal-related transcriptional regulator [Ruminococcaceae bacterium OttesenSCG-928-I18]|nr:LuxR C-terminal-related transcriptional regulator [Ruminococcaceae bacterium OttesenSCG-928-I18]